MKKRRRFIEESGADHGGETWKPWWATRGLLTFAASAVVAAGLAACGSSSESGPRELTFFVAIQPGGTIEKISETCSKQNFEDVAVIGDLKQERGVVFEAEIDLVESLGSDLYAYFHIESAGVQSDQLADLVDESLAETGAAETREGHEQIVARLDPTSKVRRRETAELWADTAKLHLFDPESGDTLKAR